MKRNFWVTAVVLFATGVWASSAIALEPLGSPAAGLNEGQWGVGLDFSHSSTNIRMTNGKSESSEGITAAVNYWKIKDFKADVATVYIGCGLTNQLEGFLRLGGLITEDSKGKLYDSPLKYYGHTGTAFGFGGKATFWEQDELKLGGIAQFNWAKPNGKIKIDWTNVGLWSYSADLVVMSMQIAAGPTYRLSDDISVYGGPFLQYIRGDIKITGSDPTDSTYTEKHGADIRQESCFGGFIGMQIELSKNNPLNIEYQHTATDNAIALNIVWKY